MAIALRYVADLSEADIATAGAYLVTDAVVRDEARTVELAGATGASAVAGSDDEHCSGYAEPRAPAAVDELRYLPRWLPPGREIDSTFARAELVDRETCLRVPVALSAARFAPGRDRIDATITLEGPSPLPYRRWPTDSGRAQTGVELITLL
jgi:hypothetical protein